MVVAVQQPLAECTAIFPVYCKTPLTSLYSENTQNLHRSTVEQIQKIPKSKVNVLATPNTLILANRPKSVILKYGNKACEKYSAKLQQWYC